MTVREHIEIHLRTGPGRHRGFGDGLARRTIDITPGAAWRRLGRTVLAGLLLIVGLPLLWLLGGLVMLALIGVLAVLLLVAALRPAWARRRRAPTDLST